MSHYMTLPEIRAALPGAWVEDVDSTHLHRMTLELGPDVALAVRVRRIETIEADNRREASFGRPPLRPLLGVELVCVYDGNAVVQDVLMLVRWAAGAIARAILMGETVTHLPPWLYERVDTELENALTRIAAARAAIKETTQ